MTLNPFELRGPEFLAFYSVLAGATIFLVWKLRKRDEGENESIVSPVHETAQDPYQVAFLRGGRFEVVRVALVSLIERGFLKAEGKYIRAAIPDAVNKVRRPLDRAILNRFGSTSKTTSANVVFSNTPIMDEADHIGELLEQKGLLPDDKVRASRKLRIVAALAFLWIIAGVKLFYALSQGRTNVGFLLVLAAVMPVPIFLVSRRFRTHLGDKVHAEIQGMFSSLRERKDSSANSSNSEATFLTAAYGMAALPLAYAAYVDPLELRPPKPESKLLSGGSCGSSCASFSSGSSCGGGGSSCSSGGCGGGGCGGGCGGCGG